MVERAARHPIGTPCPSQLGVKSFWNFAVVTVAKVSSKWRKPEPHVDLAPELTREGLSIGLVAFPRFLLYSQGIQGSKENPGPALLPEEVGFSLHPGLRSQ